MWKTLGVKLYKNAYNYICWWESNVTHFSAKIQAGKFLRKY